jgi:hypothetical protein
MHCAKTFRKLGSRKNELELIWHAKTARYFKECSVLARIFFKGGIFKSLSLACKKNLFQKLLKMVAKIAFFDETMFFLLK